jgi:hypothetical protein
MNVHVTHAATKLWVFFTAYYKWCLRVHFPWYNGQYTGWNVFLPIKLRQGCNSQVYTYFCGARGEDNTMLQAITLMDCTLFLNYPHLKSTDDTTMACNLSVLPQNSFHNTVCTFKSQSNSQCCSTYPTTVFVSLSHLRITLRTQLWQLAIINWLSISIFGPYITFKKAELMFLQRNQLKVQYYFKVIRLDDYRIMTWFLAGAKRFTLFQSTQTGSEAHPASPSKGTGVKCSGCKADHLPLSSAEFMNVWSYTSTGIYIHGMVNN